MPVPARCCTGRIVLERQPSRGIGGLLLRFSTRDGKKKERAASRGRRSPLDRPPQSAEFRCSRLVSGLRNGPFGRSRHLPGRPASGIRRDLSFRYRCGGSTGFRPASQLSTPTGSGWHPEHGQQTIWGAKQPSGLRHPQCPQRHLPAKAVSASPCSRLTAGSEPVGSPRHGSPAVKVGAKRESGAKPELSRNCKR